MSYSRYGNSVFYTFWRSSNAEFMQDEVFSVCGVIDFKYQDLKDNINRCIKLVNKKEKYARTKEELDELKGYMMEFIDDVEECYKDNLKQLYHDGKITLEEYFIEKIDK